MTGFGQHLEKIKLTNYRNCVLTIFYLSIAPIVFVSTRTFIKLGSPYVSFFRKGFLIIDTLLPTIGSVGVLFIFLEHSRKMLLRKVIFLFFREVGMRPVISNYGRSVFVNLNEKRRGKDKQ